MINELMEQYGPEISSLIEKFKDINESLKQSELPNNWVYGSDVEILASGKVYFSKLLKNDEELSELLKKYECLGFKITQDEGLNPLITSLNGNASLITPEGEIIMNYFGKISIPLEKIPHDKKLVRRCKEINQRLNKNYPCISITIPTDCEISKYLL